MSASSLSAPQRIDIIDLDRYLRSAVRPPDARRARSRERPAVDVDSQRLVVDAGGGGGARGKRYWHDSGVSDSSGGGQRRAHRRAGGRRRRRGGSTQELRAACERALRQQRQQIARVTQLCRSLAAERAPPAARSVSRRSFGQNVSPRPRRRRSGSSGSDAARSADRRTESCATCDIIACKLEELSRTYAARRSAPDAASRPAPAARCAVTRVHELDIRPQSARRVPASVARRDIRGPFGAGRTDTWQQRLCDACGYISARRLQRWPGKSPADARRVARRVAVRAVPRRVARAAAVRRAAAARWLLMNKLICVN
ncbi:uncharacterized protein LOC112055662 isoform X2 [Bicyclus anynana]|uniref:Uncharacterized protein LOC112055662 isoform X2 n=1 Tax=Bicyclus anynana TaxID=110368 RepID=A0ABM3LVE1_BICAN|nr:uncharacterized protein LOC112055662 isoform X2 [Bicyclus anynana]